MRATLTDENLAVELALRAWEPSQRRVESLSSELSVMNCRTDRRQPIWPSGYN
ncbi:MAG: hypothetical protein O2955_15195 [Planctomycetota bacterium]|nr:hypothetical protein [Planctomycetota bacterium]MDA1213859.1 hypothetical protein [Planctomycetota bacterium]